MTVYRFLISRNPLLKCLVGLILILIFTSIGVLQSAITHHKEAPTLGVQIMGIRPFADSWNNIHTFLTFDYDIANSAAIASRYDFVWGAEPSHVTALHAANPNIFLTYYIPFHRDFGTYSTTGTPVSPGYWKSVHPDWVLYKCDRRTPAYEYGMPNMPLAFSNPAVIAWQIATYALPASAYGYDGIAADNLDLQNSFGACGSYQGGKWVQRYTGQSNDPTWSTDVVNWLTQMQSALHSLSHPLALIPNLSGISPGDPMMTQVLNHIDGVLDERGFTSWGDGHLTGAQWVQSIGLMELVQQQNKPYFGINLFHKVTPAGIQWALASYLMGKEHAAALFISTVNRYGSDAWRSEYSALIGSPKGAMYQAQNVYWRSYSGGVSIVNPSATRSYTIILSPGYHYVDLSGNVVGPTIMMAPHSGNVLLSTSNGASRSKGIPYRRRTSDSPLDSNSGRGRWLPGGQAPSVS